MSSFIKEAINPKTGKEEDAKYIDDFFGAHRYAVIFGDWPYGKYDLYSESMHKYKTTFKYEIDDIVINKLNLRCRIKKRWFDEKGRKRYLVENAEDESHFTEEEFVTGKQDEQWELGEYLIKRKE